MRSDCLKPRVRCHPTAFDRHIRRAYSACYVASTYCACVAQWLYGTLLLTRKLRFRSRGGRISMQPKCGRPVRSTMCQCTLENTPDGRNFRSLPLPASWSVFARETLDIITITYDGVVKRLVAFQNCGELDVVVSRTPFATGLV